MKRSCEATHGVRRVRWRIYDVLRYSLAEGSDPTMVSVPADGPQLSRGRDGEALPRFTRIHFRLESLQR
jgi:hypothetical protein